MADIQIPDTPDEFFTKVLVAEFADQASDIEGDGPGAVCFSLTDLGSWSLIIKGGEMTATKGRDDDTLVEITMDGSDWKASAERMLGGGMGPLAGDGGGGGITSVLGNPTAATTLKAAQGTMKMVTKTDGDDEWIAITFGGAEANIDSPRATITMPQEVAEEMQGGNANPQELFMSGKIQITGDMMMLMQLAPLMQ